MATNNVSFYDPKSESDSKRKRALAQALIEQGQPTGTERVGRYVVPKSGLEQLVKAGSNAYGQYLGAQADNQDAERSSLRQKAIADALSGGDVNQTIGVLAQDPNTEGAAIQLYAKSLKNNEPFGVQSAGFEGDIARAMYALEDPSADETTKARAQAVLNTAQSLKGSWNPVTGNWDANQGRYLNGSSQQAVQTPQAQMPQQPQVNMPMQPQVGQSMPQSGGGALLPPPSMGGGQPDMSMFQGSPQGFQYSGNPKLDQARMEAEAKAQIELNTAEAIAAAKARGANAPEIDKRDVDNQMQASLIQDLTNMNAGTLDVPFAGSTQTLSRLIPGDTAKKHSESVDLLKQARLDLAAPLAKQLGVNPTDKDFQASLDRIFDLNSSKTSRQNQIDALSKRIQERKRIQSGLGQNPRLNAPSQDQSNMIQRLRQGGFSEERIQQYLQSQGGQ